MGGPIRAVKGFLVALLLFGLVILVSQLGLIDAIRDRVESDETATADDEPGIGDGREIAKNPENGYEPERDGEPVVLIRVVDGDSLELEIDGEAVDVRIEGINAPELFGDDGRTCNGEASKAALEDLVVGSDLLIVGAEVDRFGRRLGDVMADDRSDGVWRSVAFSLVDSGHALSTGDTPELRATMKDAAAAGRGLWGDGCGARGQERLVIGETQVDPPGSDRDNLNDEWVTVVNEGTVAVELEGWIISDDTTSHRFELDGALGPGDRLTVRSGSGGRSDGEVYLNEGFPVWSNRGETVLLTDPNGVVSAWRFIDG